VSENEGRIICRQNARLGGSIARWGLPVLTYCEVRLIPMIAYQQPVLTDAMFVGFSKLCGLRFERIDDPSRANLVFATGRGPRAQFDGPGGTLAYAYMPSGSNFRGQLGIYFDLDDLWSPLENPTTAPKEILFLPVNRHESCHALGLDHSSGPRDLMSPTYSWLVRDLMGTDIARLQQLYPLKGVPAPKPNTPIDPSRLRDLLAEAEAEMEIVLRAGGVDICRLKGAIPS